MGATFLPGALSLNDAVIVASRPGLRLWKADANGSSFTLLYLSFEFIYLPQSMYRKLTKVQFKAKHS